ncbi:MAG: sugar phosphate nucleotidyltransferase [Verrucomicrobiota bacterium]|nr:sugar phosphate nucleotidyltransferase [Verrucomicrobiota bacterium]
MWGIIPAAGAGSRIQPLAFSKELLPVGSRFDGLVERPRAVSEYLLERLLLGGATRICFVIAPGKSDILEYYGGSHLDSARLSFVVQPRPTGLCDAIFRALPLIRPEDDVAIGLPDTIWFPEDGFQQLESGKLSFLLFPVQNPHLFDAVMTDDAGRILEIQVKRSDPASQWVWGALKLPGFILHDLHQLWCRRGKQDEFLGTLVNAWIESGGEAYGVRGGQAYVDVGTLNGYREAIRLLGEKSSLEPVPPASIGSAAALL